MLSLMQANDIILKDRPAAIKMVSKFLKMPAELTTELMPKVEYDMRGRTEIAVRVDASGTVSAEGLFLR